METSSFLHFIIGQLILSFLQVVSDQARDDTVSSFQKMLKEDAYQPPTSDLICREEVCKIGRL